MDIVWISGASSGIGAAMASAVPDPDARLIGIGRRPPATGEHVSADLSRPDAWPRVATHFADVLAAGDVRSAVFVHMSGIGTPVGPVVDADPEAYTAAVLLNAASGQVLGQAFLAACERAGVRPTLVLCSSPAAAAPAPGASHYGAGKSALEYWAAAVAVEVEGWGRVFSVVPYAVDTPMVRETIAHPEATPIAAKLRAAAENGLLASAESTAAQIWSAVLDDTVNGAAVPVGAVPAGVGGAR
jgi:benzil reductase ((S)-benzoin forming)